MTRRSHQRRGALLAAAGVAVLGACQGASETRTGLLEVTVSEPVGVMGTRTSLAVVLPAGESARAREILRSAEAELRRIEALMSTWITASEVSSLNGAAAGELVALSTDSLEVLRASRQLFEETNGAFDVTCRPLIERWRLAGHEGELPTEEDLAERRGESEWSQIEVLERGARKSQSTACVDLSGIAKGYAIDRALSAMRLAGAPGGLVEVGGDLRVFGVGPGNDPWTVGIRSPFEDRAWGEMALKDAAVCTSGDYARFIEVEGRRFSEVIDPRTGHPAGSASSVTVVAGDAMTADAWATALTVLGPEGLELLPPAAGIEALIVSGDKAGEHQIQASAGFSALLVSAEFVLP